MSLIKRRKTISYFYLALLIIILAIFNPLTLVTLDPSPPLSAETFRQILLINLVVFLLFITLVFYESPLSTSFYISLFVLFMSISVPFILLEVILRTTTLLDQSDSPNPSYIPMYMRSYDEEIEMTGFITREGFRTSKETNSLLSKLKKDKKCKVVVIGDSFVWGAGLKPEKRWPDKLSKLINCNVYPFGKNGWTTIEQLNFYHQSLVDIDFDYLLIGIVENDPHPRGNFLHHKYKPNIYIRTNWGFLQMLGLNSFHQILSDVSYSYDFTSQLFASIVTPLIKNEGSMKNLPIQTAGYKSWRDRLYEDDVYQIWENVLFDFTNISNHSYGFILTPTAGNIYGKKIWTKIEGTILQLQAPYINLYTPTAEIFNGEPRPRAAWANPADPHPGDAQTTLYAEGALKVLEELGYKD